MSRRLYAELDLMETNPAAPRGSQLHQEMVSDFVRNALQRDEDLKRAVAADADVLTLFRTKSDADLAEAGLKRVATTTKNEGSMGAPRGATGAAAGAADRSGGSKAGGGHGAL